jgi:hypothetical protein
VSTPSGSASVFVSWSHTIRVRLCRVVRASERTHASHQRLRAAVRCEVWTSRVI